MLRLSTLDLRISCDFLSGRFSMQKKPSKALAWTVWPVPPYHRKGELMERLRVFPQMRNCLAQL